MVQISHGLSWARIDERTKSDHHNDAGLHVLAIDIPSPPPPPQPNGQRIALLLIEAELSTALPVPRTL